MLLTNGVGQKLNCVSEIKGNLIIVTLAYSTYLTKYAKVSTKPPNSSDYVMTYERCVGLILDKKGIFFILFWSFSLLKGKCWLLWEGF